MTEPTKPNYLPWIAVAVLAFLLYRGQATTVEPKPDVPKPAPTVSISKVLDGVYKQDRSDRLKLLKELSTKQFANDKAKMDWYNGESTALRIQTNTPWTDKVAEAIFNEAVAELAKQLEAGR